MQRPRHRKFCHGARAARYALRERYASASSQRAMLTALHAAAVAFRPLIS